MPPPQKSADSDDRVDEQNSYKPRALECRPDGESEGSARYSP
jgi:hypothetical protein